jgi:hypothetical protein
MLGFFGDGISQGILQTHDAQHSGGLYEKDPCDVVSIDADFDRLDAGCSGGWIAKYLGWKIINDLVIEHVRVRV